MSDIRLNDRDLLAFKTIWRFRFCLGRQIKELCSFKGARACDARLKKLVDADYITRKHILYGVPALYFVTSKVAKVLPLRYYEHKIRIEQILHDITVIDTVIYLIHHKSLSLDDFKTAKELHGSDGFGGRKHQPDAIYTHDDKTIAIEVELSLKTKLRLLNNIQDNYLQYDGQLWVIPDTEPKIKQMIDEAKQSYSDIHVISYEVIAEYARYQRWGVNKDT